MTKLIIGGAIIILILSLSFTSNAGKSKTYWINGGREVLAFVEIDPGSNQFMPVKLTISGRQQITLKHKRSGPGLWAFELKGLIVEDDAGPKLPLELEGYIIVKKRWLTIK